MKAERAQHARVAHGLRLQTGSHTFQGLLTRRLVFSLIVLLLPSFRDLKVLEMETPHEPSLWSQAWSPNPGRGSG